MGGKTASHLNHCLEMNGVSKYLHACVIDIEGKVSIADLERRRFVVD